MAAPRENLFLFRAKSVPPRIGGHAGGPQEHFDMTVPEHRSRHIKAVVGGRVRSPGQFPELQDKRDPLGTESHQPIQRSRTGAKGRGAEHEPALEGGLGIAEQRHHEPGPGAEAPEDSAFAHPGALGQPVHGESVRPALLNELTGSLEQQLPVAGGVAAFRFPA